MEFVAVDVETANPDIRSICQIGIAHFRDGRLAESWQTLVNPQTRFDRGNVSIHGIEAHVVAQAPTFIEVFDEVRTRFAGAIVASHTTFDRRAIAGAAELHGLALPQCRWLDTTKVVRRAWPDVATKGFGLANLARRFDIAFKHHDALEDARAAGELLVRAVSDTGISVEDWLVQTAAPTRRKSAIPANPDGPLFGEVVVFSGSLRCSRRELGQRAADAGCDLTTTLGDRATLLVIGDRDPVTAVRTAKHRRAEAMIDEGRPLRIISETEFLKLLAIGA